MLPMLDPATGRPAEMNLELFAELWRALRRRLSRRRTWPDRR